MKYLIALVSCTITFILTFGAFELYASISDRQYCNESCGRYGYVMLFLLLYVPLSGAFVGWKFANTKNYKYLLFFPSYFILMLGLAYYSSNYAKISFLS